MPTHLGVEINRNKHFMGASMSEADSNDEAALSNVDLDAPNCTQRKEKM